MADNLTPEKRSWNMSRIKAKDTKPEILVRSFLHKNGYRYRLHLKSLPGKPDIVLRKYKSIIFVHGCFWHQHLNCKKASIPKTNIEFWTKKFSQNIEKFKKDKLELEKLGWKVLVIWECEIENLSAMRNKICNFLK